MNETFLTHQYPAGPRLQIVQGDITLEVVDAIVNAANEHLAHGGGVAAVIARKGGPAIDAESRQWIEEHGPVSHEIPAITTAGELPAKFVLHAVGPVWGSGDEDARLGAAVSGIFLRMDEYSLKTAALPAISTGIFGFPMARAAVVIFAAIQEYFESNPYSGIEVLRLVLFDQEALEVFLQAFEKYNRA